MPEMHLNLENHGSRPLLSHSGSVLTDYHHGEHSRSTVEAVHRTTIFWAPISTVMELLDARIAANAASTVLVCQHRYDT